MAEWVGKLTVGGLSDGGAEEASQQAGKEKAQLACALRATSPSPHPRPAYINVSPHSRQSPDGRPRRACLFDLCWLLRVSLARAACGRTSAAAAAAATLMAHRRRPTLTRLPLLPPASNVFALEHVLQKAPDVGSVSQFSISRRKAIPRADRLPLYPSFGARTGVLRSSLITLLQFLFVTLQTLPSQVTFTQPARNERLPSGEVVRLPSGGSAWLPRLRTRQVPLRRWLVQVVLFFVRFARSMGLAAR